MTDDKKEKEKEQGWIDQLLMNQLIRSKSIKFPILIRLKKVIKLILEIF